MALFNEATRSALISVSTESSRVQGFGRGEGWLVYHENASRNRFEEQIMSVGMDEGMFIAVRF